MLNAFEIILSDIYENPAQLALSYLMTTHRKLTCYTLWIDYIAKREVYHIWLDIGSNICVIRTALHVNVIYLRCISVSVFNIKKTTKV